MNHKQEIVNTLQRMSGKYSTYEIFSDWIKCCALAISNQSDLFRDNEIWESREQEYLATIRKYLPEEAQEFTRMLAELAFALEDEITDVLGEVYMAAGMGNKSTGQFLHRTICRKHLPGLRSRQTFRRRNHWYWMNQVREVAA